MGFKCFSYIVYAIIDGVALRIRKSALRSSADDEKWIGSLVVGLKPVSAIINSGIKHVKIALSLQ